MRSGAPFAFAGLWGAWKNPATMEWLQSFTILTTDPNELVGTVHGRMPVILEAKDYGRWLARGSGEQLPLDLLRPFGAEGMVKEAAEGKTEDGGEEPDSL